MNSQHNPPTHGPASAAAPTSPFPVGERPPAARFALAGLVSPGEATTLAELESELNCLFRDVAESRHSAIKERAMQARIAAGRDPSRENIQIMDAAIALATQARQDPLRFTQMRRVLERRLWDFYDARVRPLLGDLLCRALDAARAERAAQLVRESEWRERMREFDEWAAYYGASLNLTGLPSAVLAHRILSIEAALAGVGQQVNREGGVPPRSPRNIIEAAGLFLPAPNSSAANS